MDSGVVGVGGGAVTRFAAGFRPLGVHAVPRAPDGTASVGVCLWR